MMRNALFGAAAMVAMTATLLGGCGGGGGSEPVTPPPGGGGPITPQLPSPASAPALKTSLAAKFGVVNFPIGAAIEPASTTNADSALLLKHFSSLTAENAMKPDTVWPSIPQTSQPGTPNFTNADTIANYAVANGIRLRGHTLLWHRTIPAWMLEGPREDGQEANYRLALQQHLRDYIFAVVQRYPEIYAWDVVNEVASDTQNAQNPYRTDSLWWAAYSHGGMNGADYVRDAFIYADQARTSIGKNSASMKLMLNDYNTELPGKRANVMQIVQSLVTEGVPIDGVGHQLHLQLGVDVAQVTAAFTAVEGISTTLVNHVTELDVSIYADPGSCYAQQTIPPCLANYGASPPQSVLSQQATLYRALFNAFNRPSVQSVTFWGIADNHTWLNSYPVARTNRPLLFDTNRDPKWAFWTVVDPAINVP